MNKPEANGPGSGTGTGLNKPVSQQRLNSAQLFGTSREIIIEHGSDAYRLRLTSQNKLILTK